MKTRSVHAVDMAYAWAGALVGLWAILHFTGFNALHHFTLLQGGLLWAAALFALYFVSARRHPARIMHGLCMVLGFLCTGVTLYMIA